MVKKRVKPYEMGDSRETIRGLSDEDLNAYLTDDRFINSGSLEFAIAEINRRQMNKIAKSTSKIGKNTWLAIIGFGIIVLTLIFTVLAFFFK